LSGLDSPHNRPRSSLGALVWGCADIL
jgi:hypothetical protein